jgi:hypothetical protein
MRLILEETVQNKFGSRGLRRAEISVDYDDLTVDDVLYDLVKPAMIAMTYSPENLNEYLPEE